MLYDEPILPTVLGFVVFGLMIWLLSLIPWAFISQWLTWIGHRPRPGWYVPNTEGKREFKKDLREWHKVRPRRKVEGRWSKF